MIHPETIKSIHRQIMEVVYNKYSGKAFGKTRPAFDGSRNLFTIQDLPIGKDGIKLVVTLPNDEKDRRFTVSIKCFLITSS